MRNAATVESPDLRNLRVVLAGGTALGSSFLQERVPFAEVLSIDASDQEGLRRALSEAEVVVCTELRPGDTVDACRLRLVQVLGAGVDGVARDALPAGCVLCNTHGHETAVGEWALMAMLTLTRRLLLYDRDLRRGEWHGAASFTGTPERDLCGRTLGTIGLGHIGSRVVALARALGMRAVAVTRSPSSERAAQHGLEWLGGMDSLPRLLEESDFALVCVPLTPETTGLIGPEELELLGPDAYLLNVARGPVVDESALYTALRERTIAGAAIDAWYRYPDKLGERTLPASLPFWELKNVVMTPHSAGWSESTVRRRWQFVAEQLVRLSEGKPLSNIVLRGGEV